MIELYSLRSLHPLTGYPLAHAQFFVTIFAVERQGCLPNEIIHVNDEFDLSKDCLVCLYLVFICDVVIVIVVATIYYHIHTYIYTIIRLAN